MFNVVFHETFPVKVAIHDLFIGGYELSGHQWNNHLFINMCGWLKNMILDKSIAVLNNKMRNLLFHIEFLINDGACLIHEGNRAPGRCIKK